MAKKKYAWLANNRFTILSLLIVVIMFVIVRLYHPQGVTPQDTLIGGSIAAGTAEIGGDFEMLDHTGKPFTQENLKKKFSLVFFGFTFCPDICPTSLLLMQQVKGALPPKFVKNLQVVFVTIDPDRDTPEVLKEYLASIMPSAIGLTGTEKQVKQMADAYRVYYAKNKKTKNQDFYLMDHSGFIYLMGPDGKYLKHFSHKTSKEEMIQELKGLMYR